MTADKNKLTPKQEAFAINLFKGLSQREAYIQAGYSSRSTLKSIDEMACVVANSPKISSRLRGLQEETKDKTIAGVKERQQILTEIVRGRVIDYTKNKRIEVNQESPNTAAIQGLDTSEVSVGKGDAAIVVDITKLRLNNPITAIAELNKMDHVYDEKPQFNDNRVINFIVQDEETKALLEKARAGNRPKLTEGEPDAAE